MYEVEPNIKFEYQISQRSRDTKYYYVSVQLSLDWIYKRHRLNVSNLIVSLHALIHRRSSVRSYSIVIERRYNVFILLSDVKYNFRHRLHITCYSVFVISLPLKP